MAESPVTVQGPGLPKHPLELSGKYCLVEVLIKPPISSGLEQVRTIDVPVEVRYLLYSFIESLNARAYIHLVEKPVICNVSN